METDSAAKQEPNEQESPPAESEQLDPMEDEPGSEETDEVEDSSTGNAAIVEAIIDVKRGQYKKLWFLVKWEGYSEEESTWEPGDNLEATSAVIKEMIREFKITRTDLMAKVASKPRTPKVAKTKTLFVEKEEFENTHDSSGEIYDRELTDSDPFYGQQAGELRGELRGLYDPSHKVSSKELILAKINSMERITRGSAKKMGVDLPTSSRGSGVNSPAPSTPSPKPKRKSGTKRESTKPKIKPVINDDLYSAEDDGQESSQDVPEKSEPVIEPVESPPKEAYKRKVEELLVQNEEQDSDDEVLKGTVLRTNVNWFVKAQKAPPIFPEQITVNTIRKYVINPVGLKLKSIYSMLTPKDCERFFTHRDPKTRENWLHLMLANNEKCVGSHELDTVIRVMCHDFDDRLLDQANPANGYTPLHLAVEKNMCCTVRTILCYPLNLNAKTKKGETALAIAIRKNNPLITKFLLEAGASYDELQGKVKRDSNEAVNTLNQHVFKFKKMAELVREQYLTANNLQEITTCCDLFRHPGNSGTTFKFQFNFQPYRLPDSTFTYLLFIYVAGINGDNWSIRCTDDFRQRAAPKLNDLPLLHVQRSDWPMVFLCPLQKGCNTIELLGKSEFWKLYPIIAANIVLVRDRPEMIPVPNAEPETPLEVTPLVGPI